MWAYMCVYYAQPTIIMPSASPDFSVGRQVLLSTSNLIPKIFSLSGTAYSESGKVYQTQSNFQGMWQLEGVYSSHTEHVETEHTRR